MKVFAFASLVNFEEQRWIKCQIFWGSSSLQTPLTSSFGISRSNKQGSAPHQELLYVVSVIILTDSGLWGSHHSCNDDDGGGPHHWDRSQSETTNQTTVRWMCQRATYADNMSLISSLSIDHLHLSTCQLSRSAQRVLGVHKRGRFRRCCLN